VEKKYGTIISLASFLRLPTLDALAKSIGSGGQNIKPITVSARRDARPRAKAPCLTN